MTFLLLGTTIIPKESLDVLCALPGLTLRPYAVLSGLSMPPFGIHSPPAPTRWGVPFAQELRVAAVRLTGRFRPVRFLPVPTHFFLHF